MRKSNAMKKTRIGQILTRLVSEKKICLAELARQINVPQPTVHRIANGICEHPHLSSLEPIARFFSITVEQLKGLEPIPWLDRLTKIPLLTWEEAVTWPADKMDMSTKERLFTDANIGVNGYALKMKDASMEPVFPENTLLIADPDKPPRDRSYVVAKLAHFKEPIFRQLLIDAHEHYLKALSPDFNQYKMIRLNPGDSILSIVVQTKRNYEI